MRKFLLLVLLFSLYGAACAQISPNWFQALTRKKSASGWPALALWRRFTATVKFVTCFPAAVVAVLGSAVRFPMMYT